MKKPIFGREKYREINANLNAQMQEKKCLIAQHRGAHEGNIPQNTALAYKASLLLGADMFELDVSKSTDGTLYCFHDTTEDINLRLHTNIEKYSSAAIAEFGLYNSIWEPSGYRVQTMEEVLQVAYRVLELTHNQVEYPKPRYTADRSPEYWAGWALAYYQWETAMPFEEILGYIPLDEIIRVYSPYHEMDIRHFCDWMNERYRNANPETKLKQRRQRAGLSQNDLAELSGVPKRTIQQYEQRQKSINKAQAEYLLMLAQILHCNAEDLIEPLE